MKNEKLRAAIYDCYLLKERLWHNLCSAGFIGSKKVQRTVIFVANFIRIR